MVPRNTTTTAVGRVFHARASAIPGTRYKIRLVGSEKKRSDRRKRLHWNGERGRETTSTTYSSSSSSSSSTGVVHARQRKKRLWRRAEKGEEVAYCGRRKLPAQGEIPPQQHHIARMSAVYRYTGILARRQY